MKKPESAAEKLFRSVVPRRMSLILARYRGVILVACVPVLLIATILVFVPRSSPLSERTHTLKELRHKGGQALAEAHKAAANAGGGKAVAVGTNDEASGSFKYAVVLDAGSTGSRVHVFKFQQEEGSSKLVLISDTFEQLKPGLSSYADDPAAAANSLKPLIEVAVKAIPEAAQAGTPISLKATAGLRLLPGSKADNILAAVVKLLDASPFDLKEGAVGILDGKDEGAFAWLTLNYLLGNLGGTADATAAAIDLGGGSVQEAFALSEGEAALAPEGYTTTLQGMGSTYSVYVHSYLGYGLMAARAKVIAAAAKADEGHPCFGAGSGSKYMYAGKELAYVPLKGSAHAEHCGLTSLAALEHASKCGRPEEECSFNGAWRGKPTTKPRKYYISSYFWDRAVETGIVTDTKALSWETTPADFLAKAKAACALDLAGLAKAYLGVKPDQASFLCLDLSFAHTLLTQGFDLPAQTKITLVKQVLYNGQPIEAAWPLGAAINDLAKAQP